MTYLEFHNQWSMLGCFSIQQVMAWQPDFNRINLYHWLDKGYIVKLRKGWYAFRECLAWPDFRQYIANKIYSPSYISLHSALAHYGIIPEAVLKETSVTSLKTESFINDFGEFSYQSVRPDLMFGYEPKLLTDGRAVFFATPEKALFDLLYLYPFYSTPSDMLELRLDDDYMHDDFDMKLFLGYIERADIRALSGRAQILLKAYEL